MSYEYEVLVLSGEVPGTPLPVSDAEFLFKHLEKDSNLIFSEKNYVVYGKHVMIVEGTYKCSLGVGEI
ncbi:hypothetical protein [Pseudomonas sp. C5pp]|uniref:hypothetical protein n=1 Tax=Pseudomonas sp. C5pp TaxID=1586081 RepID=UPI00057DF248|nr:hypothetical protein [Pseudomonas sp. C5pp]KIC84527.1 hypothetical protein RR51_01150 [Pseudomonas sp. C5pp]